MVLGVSIGNTRIALGLGGENIRYPSTVLENKGKITQAIEQFIKSNNMRQNDITGAICASVNPRLTPALEEAVAQICGIKPYMVHGEMPMLLDLSRYDKKTIGSDRIAVCEAAVTRYPMPAVIFDFGTAITINVINDKKTFLGGSILPGLKIGLDVLANNTAQLPAVSLTLPPPNTLLGLTTEDSIISGVTHCTGAMVDGMVQRIENQILGNNNNKTTVLFTGGDAEYVLPFCKRDAVHVPELLMEGLFLLYSRMKG